MKKYDKIVEYLMTELSFSDKIIMKVLKKYTYKILRKGIYIGFNWEEKEVNLKDEKSTNCQPRQSKQK